MIADIFLNITPDTLCNTSNVPVQLDAGLRGGIEPYIYSWTPDASLSCTSCKNPIAKIIGDNIYSVTVTDSNGCFRRDSLTVVNSTYTVNAILDRAACI